MNNFNYSNTNKRYYTLDYYFKERFNTKVGRIPINGGFTCPNIDGTTGFGGCTFCSIKGSGDYAGYRTEDLLEQWDNGKEMMMKKWKDATFIAYFQAFSNTYAPVEVLKEKFEGSVFVISIDLPSQERHANLNHIITLETLVEELVASVFNSENFFSSF